MGRLLEQRTARLCAHYQECTTRTLASQIPRANSSFQAQDVAQPRMPHAPLRIDTLQRDVGLALQPDTRRTSTTNYSLSVLNIISPQKHTLSSRL
jgi:hypothetical protein